MECPHPDLMRHHAAKKKVMQGLLLLFIEGASQQTGQPTMLKHVNPPTTVLRRESREELATVRGPRAPNFLGVSGLLLANKEGPIGRHGIIAIVARPSSQKHIIVVWARWKLSNLYHNKKNSGRASSPMSGPQSRSH
jgi:hypothetical protein